MIALTIIGMLLAGLAEGMMDKLQFHLPEKLWGNNFWDPGISWMNKYGPDGTYRFWGSTTVLVFLTDGWHLMKWVRNRGVDLAMLGCGMTIWEVIIVRAIYGVGFAVMYRKE
jgi:hypothetical protein